MNMKDFLNELRRYHNITDNVTHFIKGCFLLIRHPIRIDVLLDRLHLKVHVTLGAIVATGLALCRLAFSFSLLFFFGFGFRLSGFLAFRLVLHHFGEAAHLTLCFRKAVVAILQQGFHVGYGLLHSLHGRAQLRNGCIQIGYGHAQLEVSRIGGLQLTLKHLYDHILPIFKTKCSTSYTNIGIFTQMRKFNTLIHNALMVTFSPFDMCLAIMREG